MSVARVAKFGLISLLFAPALLLAASASTVSLVDDAPSIKVRYQDLNLENPQGIVTLYRRIHDAAADVCRISEAPQLFNHAPWNLRNDCATHAIANAVKDAHNEKLSAYHWQQIRARNVFAKDLQRN